MNLNAAIIDTTTTPGTDYTLTPHGVAAVIYTYDSLEQGAYTYVEYYRDEDYAYAALEDDRAGARDNRKLAKRLTREEMDEEMGGDWITAVKMKRF